jgi:hypothetical protein
MSLASPQVDESCIRQIWLSCYILPAVCAAIEMGMFELLAEKSATIDELAGQLELAPVASAISFHAREGDTA